MWASAKVVMDERNLNRDKTSVVAGDAFFAWA
jgi:hypothetical protein